jgi:hypothetical protein
VSRLTICLASLLAFAQAAGPAAGQIVYPGDTRVEMSDVTGPPLTSGDLFGPGTVRSFTCPVAWGVRTVADRTAASLEGGGGPPIVAAAWTDRRLSETTQRDLLIVLMDAEGDDAASRRLLDALTGGANDGAAVRSSAKGLVERLNGLLKNAGRLRPDRPGYRTATQLASVVGAYNTFIENSSAAFLRSPPEALLGIQAVLSPLVIAALENEGRDATRRAAPGSLACAAPPPAIVPPIAAPPAPPIERAVVVCVVAEDGIRAIGAIVLESGDTVVASAGTRLPLSALFPDTIAFAGDAEWYASADELTLNGRRYMRFGLPRLASPDADLRRVGEYGGVPLFAEAGEDHVVVPVRPGCLMQDYRPERYLRVRG